MNPINKNVHEDRNGKKIQWKRRTFNVITANDLDTLQMNVKANMVPKAKTM